VQEPLTEEEAFELGVRAYIYAYPLLVLDSVRRVTTNVASPPGPLSPMGQFAHYRVFPNAADRTIAGASLDTLYSLAWLDLSQGPYVLHVPEVRDRFFMMPILDGWTEVIGNPGTRTTGGRAGDYVITGPQWTGALPTGVQQIESGTDMVLIVGRTYSSGTSADYQAVHAVQDQYTLVPLSIFGDAQPDVDEGVVDPSIDMSTPPRDQIDNLDAGDFFALFSRLVKSNPPTAEDAPMVSTLNRLGVLGDFDMSNLPDSAVRGLSRVPEAAHQQILGQYARQRQANGWMVSTGSGHYGTDYLQRALVAYIGVGGNLPDDAFYPIARFDGEGKMLNGTKSYEMRLTAADTPPVDARGFWSISVYDSEYFLVANPINRHSLGSQDPLQESPEGTVHLYIQHESPGPDKEANWLPSPAGDFILMMRLYWPRQEALDGTWNPPAVLQVGS
jgi:hypothetical protein